MRDELRDNAAPRRSDESHDGGFSLTEVMIALLLLLIAIFAMISVVVVALRVTASNTTVSAGSEAVQSRIEEARRVAVAGSCDVMEGVVTATETVQDGRGQEIQITGVLEGGCVRKTGSQQSDPAQVVRVTVTATATVDGVSTVQAQTTTDVFMKVAE